jgi:hypothetical protein
MCWLHTAAASAASGPYQMRTNIAVAAVAAERDPEAELKTAAEMLLRNRRPSTTLRTGRRGLRQRDTLKTGRAFI